MLEMEGRKEGRAGGRGRASRTLFASSASLSFLSPLSLSPSLYEVTPGNQLGVQLDQTTTATTTHGGFTTSAAYPNIYARLK